MLFGFWQLKTTVFALLLASSLGHELLRTCQRHYCYERSVERRNTETDNLRKLYGDESRRADTARETRNLDNISRGQFNSESNREIRRELTTLTENRRELVIHEPSRLEPYQLIIEINDRSVVSDFNRPVEETPEIQRAAILERTQKTNTDRFRTPISLLNQRENRQERNELRDENQEPHRFNDRLSMRQLEVFQRIEESQVERVIVDRQSRHSSDRIIESERNLLKRRERNPEERVNREYRRSDEQTTEEKPEPVQRRNQIKEEDRNHNEILTRSVLENNRDVARRETENFEIRHFNERIFERANEIRIENLRRGRENVRNMKKSRQISLTEDDLLDRYDSRLDERDRSNHRSIAQLSERTQESIQRREGSAQERDNRLKEVQRSSSRLELTEPLTEQRENLRGSNKRESLDEHHRFIEELTERNQEALQRKEINRRERTDNREFERSNSRLSAQRRLTERENERSNENLSNVEDSNELQYDFKTFGENRESLMRSQRIIEREERNVQRRIANDKERERNTERNVRDSENRRVTSRQDNQEHRYDINKRLTEREFTQQRIRDTHKRENRQPIITQQEQHLEVFNRRVEHRSVNAEFNRRQQHRYDNSPERENVLNRNRNFQRSSELLTESDEESFENRGENYRDHENRIRNSRRSEQRNNRRQADENQNSRRINERRDENGLLNSFSLRSSFFRNERESVEQLNMSDREFETRREGLRELDERVDQRESNRAADRSVGEIQRSSARIFENVNNIPESDNHNLDERKLQQETNRRLEIRRSNERQDRIESTRNNHQIVFRKREATKLQQRRDENKREQREERANQGFETFSYRNGENRRDFQFIVDEYKETPSDSLTNSNMAYVQGVLLAIVIMKTLNGKNNIKCKVSEKFQEAIAMLGF